MNSETEATKLCSLLKQSGTSCTALSNDALSLEMKKQSNYNKKSVIDIPNGISLTKLLTKFSKKDSYPILEQHGYTQKRIICNTLQGRMIEAESMEDASKRFAIKIVDKELHCKRVSKPDNGMNIMVEESILKESVLLHHCTVANKAIGDYLPQFIEFFYDQRYYYLVMEFAGDINLELFIKRAHKHIKNKKLKLKQWKKFVKFFIWQLLVALNWLHGSMGIAHLDLKTENIVIRNGNFIETSDGSELTVDPNIQIKICDWGLAEIFKQKDDGLIDFECIKHCFHHHSQFSAPKLFNDELYNAAKADIYSVGIILCKLAFNRNLYQCQDSTDDGFWSIQNHQLDAYISMNGLKQYTKSSMLNTMMAMLEIDENKRFDALQILKSEWFKSYWSAYKLRINKKSIDTKLSLKKQRLTQRMKDLPFYSM